HGLATAAIRSEEHRAAPLVQDEQCRGGERDVPGEVEIPGYPKPGRRVELDCLADELAGLPRLRPHHRRVDGEVEIKRARLRGLPNGPTEPVKDHPPREVLPQPPDRRAPG